MAIRYMTNGSSQTGTQFVTKQNGRVDYDPINQSQYTNALAGASNNNFRNQGDFQRLLKDVMIDGERQSPLTQANVFSTRTNAQVNLMDAETRRIQAQAESRSKAESNRPYVPTTRDRLFNPEFESPMSYSSKMRDGMNRFKPQIEFANNKANRQAEMELNKFLASSRLNEARINAGAGVSQARINSEGRLGEARINADAGIEQTKTNADAQVREARIQQPLSSGQVLEQTRIQNPDPIKSMAMNMLGGYVNQGTRSNFAYWG